MHQEMFLFFCFAGIHFLKKYRLEAKADFFHYLGNYSGVALSPKCICIVSMSGMGFDEYTWPASHSLHFLPVSVLPSAATLPLSV